MEQQVRNPIDERLASSSPSPKDGPAVMPLSTTKAMSHGSSQKNCLAIARLAVPLLPDRRNSMMRLGTTSIRVKLNQLKTSPREAFHAGGVCPHNHPSLVRLGEGNRAGAAG
jgi:hypothetical protein